MSKTLRMLKKSKNKNNESYSSLNDSTTTDDTSQAIFIKSADVLFEKSDKNNMSKKSRNAFLEKLDLSLVVFTLLIVLIVIAGLYLRKEQLNSPGEESSLVSRISKENRTQRDKIDMLEMKLSKIGEEKEEELLQIQSLIGEIKGDIKNINREIKEVRADRNMIKSKFDDLKVSDRLLLDKYISLNNKINNKVN